MALKHTPVPLAIIGGGAAGLFAAAVAAERRLGCLVIERKARLGSKVLMTANGRCNFTKDIPAEEMLADIGGEIADFLRPALTACPPARVANALRAGGVKIRRMQDGRLFPATGDAATVVHAFGDFLRDAGVPLLTNTAVTGLQPMKNGFLVATANFTLWAKNVLLATGGVSFPKTGSVGDGQRFARELGHTVTPFRAGLTGFETRERKVTACAGARDENGFARVLDAAGRERFAWRGEVDCETWGVGGAAVYNCQRWTAHHPGPFTLEVSFAGERVTLRDPVPRPVKEAIVTVGGVARDEVDPATMQSRKVPGLYFAGEVLDIDGPTGGYNLTMAFATARLAVLSICAAERPSAR